MSEQGFEEGDCPLCLEPLPPFWDLQDRRRIFVCCGKHCCLDCGKRSDEYLRTARDSGSYGREEEQLASKCPLCRGPILTGDDLGRSMVDRFEKSCLPLSLYRELGVRYLEGWDGVEVNVERGMEILMLGAKKTPNCQYQIGIIYGKGKYGLPKSTAEAKRWYLAATEQGHAIAEFNLGLMFLDEGDDAEFLRYMRGSASKGFGEACFNLGVAYYTGEYGAQKSEEEAIRVWTTGAEGGHVNCMKQLAKAMCNPIALDNPTFTEGMHWLRRVADEGDEYAILNLGHLEKWASGRCFMCEKTAPPETTETTSFHQCSRCRVAWYCSKDCQTQHWVAEEGGHEQFCIMWKYFCNSA